MDKEMISKKFETEEIIKEADTDYLRKHGVKRLGHRKLFSFKGNGKGY